jgi:hypothetical protein
MGMEVRMKKSTRIIVGLLTILCVALYVGYNYWKVPLVQNSIPESMPLRKELATYVYTNRNNKNFKFRERKDFMGEENKAIKIIEKHLPEGFSTLKTIELLEKNDFYCDKNLKHVEIQCGTSYYMKPAKPLLEERSNMHNFWYSGYKIPFSFNINFTSMNNKATVRDLELEWPQNPLNGPYSQPIRFYDR